MRRTTAPYRAMHAFYRNLTTLLLQYRLQQLEMVKFPSRLEAEKIHVIKTLLRQREGS